MFNRTGIIILIGIVIVSIALYILKKNLVLEETSNQLENFEDETNNLDIDKSNPLVKMQEIYDGLTILKDNMIDEQQKLKNDITRIEAVKTNIDESIAKKHNIPTEYENLKIDNLDMKNISGDTIDIKKLNVSDSLIIPSDVNIPMPDTYAGKKIVTDSLEVSQDFKYPSSMVFPIGDNVITKDITSETIKTTDLEVTGNLKIKEGSIPLPKSYDANTIKTTDLEVTNTFKYPENMTFPISKDLNANTIKTTELEVTDKIILPKTFLDNLPTSQPSQLSQPSQPQSNTFTNLILKKNQTRLVSDKRGLSVARTLGKKLTLDTAETCFAKCEEVDVKYRRNKSLKGGKTTKANACTYYDNKAKNNCRCMYVAKFRPDKMRTTNNRTSYIKL